VTCLETHYPPIEVTVPSPQLAVSIDEAKRACDYEDDDRNGQFAGWIRAATQQVEQDTETAILSQTCKLYLPWFPGVIEIHKPPVTSVSSITYTDGNGATQTLSASVYQSNLKRTPPRIRLALNQTWPTTQDDTDNAVTVTFVAGYASALTVPELFKEAIKVKVRRMYTGCGEERDMVYEGLISGLRWRPYL
jgi:uncharacterized phiE125 gp8 family phage protein